MEIDDHTSPSTNEKAGFSSEFGDVESLKSNSRTGSLVLIIMHNYFSFFLRGTHGAKRNKSVVVPVIIKKSRGSWIFEGIRLRINKISIPIDIYQQMFRSKHFEFESFLFAIM